jgi:hypothetical protein
MFGSFEGERRKNAGNFTIATSKAYRAPRRFRAQSRVVVRQETSPFAIAILGDASSTESLNERRLGNAEVRSLVIRL